MSDPQLPAVIQAVQEQLPTLSKLLPAEVSPAAFMAHFKTAVWQTPDLLACTKRSVVNALTKAANDGLVPDGREAVIIVRNSKRRDGTWEKVAVYQRMYGGTLARVRAALPGARIEARLVHDEDFFEVDYGDSPSIRHTPRFGKDKGGIVAVYAIVTEASGTRHHEVMDREEVDRIRDGSQNYDPAKPRGPWHDHYGEMARKTVLNRLAKLLPQAAGRPPLQADADDAGGAEDEVEVWDATSVPLQETSDPEKAQGTVAPLPNGGEITSGKAPFKREEAVVVPEAQDDVAMWKTRLRELRGAIAPLLSSVAVEEEWNEWEERFKPVPDDVVAAAKGLIDKRLLVIRQAADEYQKAQSGGQ